MSHRVPLILVTSVLAVSTLAMTTSNTNQPAPTPSTELTTFIPDTHHAEWSGPNRLWIYDPDKPFRSDGTITTKARSLTYTWSYNDKPQTGTMTLTGQPAAMKCEWTDSFHAPTGITFHGYTHEGVIHLFGTYPAGEGPDWGWQIKLDLRDREAFTIRMYNVVPGIGPMPAVILHSTKD